MRKSFPAHEILRDIVHVLISGFVICVEQHTISGVPCGFAGIFRFAVDRLFCLLAAGVQQ